MFESDDFDQILSQFEFPEVQPKSKATYKSTENVPEVNKEIRLPQYNAVVRENKLAESNLATASSVIATFPDTLPHTVEDTLPTVSTTVNHSTNNVFKDFVSPKHNKRKIINTHFDHNSKRKFPGPAGLLTGTLEESKDDTICHMELLSQDIEFSQNQLRGDLFDSPLWLQLSQDIKLWDLNDIDTIKSIKEQALAGNLRRRKAQTVTVFVETVDRSVTDPMIIVRDSTGYIKGTLHRDAWSNFSSYIVAEYCALVLWKPTVLTTGGAFKKHYLNITLSNIYAIYSSTAVKEEEHQLPDGYAIVSEDDFTVIKTKSAPQDLGTSTNNNGNGEQNGANENCDLLEDLDSIFSDDLF